MTRAAAEGDTFSAPAAPGEIDQDIPHYARRHREEVGAVLPGDILPIN